jgi:hypothetical protein
MTQPPVEEPELSRTLKLATAALDDQDEPIR